jgi:thioester reductase-like protein
VARAWSDVLGVAEIGIHDDFFALGGNSLVVPQVLLKVRQRTGVELPVAALLEDPTVGGLARHVEAAESTNDGAPSAEAVDLAAEAVLPPEIAPTADGEMVSPREPSAVFLTGGTGFLGAFLLDALLEDTDARVYCLVRAESPAEGRERLRENLEHFRLLGEPGLRERFERRIVPVPGDLAEPLLGLDRERFDELADTVDAVLHGGAWVNFTYPYRTLAPINVGGTVEALRLASHRRTKPFHFVSSISVFAPGSLEDGVAYEDSDLPATQGLFSGYAESKWVAERIVREAQRRGQPVTLHRPAVVGGSSVTGAGNTRDMAWSILKGAIQLGLAPQGAGGVDIAPVDYVAAAIVHLMQDPSNLGRAFHFPNPVQGNWDRLFPILSDLGYDVPLTPYRQWREALLDAERTGTDNALLPFLPLLPPAPPAPEPSETGAPVSETPPRPLVGRRDDGTNTRWGLAGSGVSCPPLGRELLATYMGYFVEIGWMPGVERAEARQ